MTLATVLVAAHSPTRPVRFTRFAGVQDVGEHSRCRRPRPSAVLEDIVAKDKGNVVSVKIVRSERGAPPGKLADAELIFEADAGPLSGLP